MPRLPQPGADAGNWGDILNEYLGVSIASDGELNAETVGITQLKPNSITNTAIIAGAVTGTKIADGTIEEIKLANAVQTKLNTPNLITSVAGKTGDVTLNKGDIGLGNADNTTDADKPVSSATQTALMAKQNRNGYVVTVATSTATANLSTAFLGAQVILTLSANVTALTLPTISAGSAGWIDVRIESINATPYTFTPPTTLAMPEDLYPTLTVTNTSIVNFALHYIDGRGWDGLIVSTGVA